MLDRLNEILDRLKAKGIGEGEAVKIVQKLIHSPLVALLVKLSPNKADDTILELLKSFVPAPA
jgi:hypothetical protein